MKPKVGIITTLSLALALGTSALPVVAETSSTPLPQVELNAEGNDFLKDLLEDGYAELGRYKVEKIKDNVYHWDEGTKDLPGGATDSSGNMNNPSSMYFVLDEEGTILVDLGNGSKVEEDIANAKTIIQSLTVNNHLSVILTHSHPDHVGWGYTNVFEGLTVDALYVSEPDYEASKDAIKQFTNVVKVNDGETVEIYGNKYDFNVVNAHTPGSLMITDKAHEAFYIGDTFGSGAVWLFWDMNEGNPIAALSDGCAKARKILNETPTLSILAGHRWQQFWDANEQRPNEMSIQYFNDMAQVINGLLDGTTITSDYSVKTFGDDAIELSSNGAKAKIDTLPKYVEAYKASVNEMAEAYVYSASDKLSIDSVNATAAAKFVVYPDGYLTDEEALKYITDSGIKEVVDRSASKVYVARPKDGRTFTESDVEGFKTIVNKIVVTSNFKLIGIGNGATFINQNLTGYMNFVSGLALVNPEEGKEVKVSVPTYLVTDQKEVVDTYVKANNAILTTDNHYQNPESHYEIVVVNNDTTLDAVTATKEAWSEVLEKFGRIGNYSEVYKEIATWYTRPLITGDEQADQSRKYQYYDSIEALKNTKRTVVTEDLNGDGIKSLWYEYVPQLAENAKDNTIPVVFLLHGNTNDPRTQYDTSGWAQIAEEEGIILVAPEWQGHTYQGYTYDPMTTDDNQTADSDMIKLLDIIKEKYPQVDASRIYLSGLSRGCINTYNAGLSNTKYFAAGAGHSGPAGASDLNKEAVQANKESYDMPIIFFTGDGDEYCKDAFDTIESNGGFQVAQLYQELNDMEVTKLEDIKEEDTDLYGIPWTTRETIEPTQENIAKMQIGTIVSDKNVEISMARIYGWGHWNYYPDAKLMWEFMSKYARNLETGESIRLDLEKEPEVTPTPTPEVTPEPTKTPEVTPTPKPTDTNKPANTADTSNTWLWVGTLVAALGITALVLTKKRKLNK